MSTEILTLQAISKQNTVEVSKIESDAAASQAAVVLENGNGFAANDFVAIEAGIETGEIRQIQSVAGKTLTLASNLIFEHLAGAKVIRLWGDQLKVYRAANVDGSVPADGDFSHATTVPATPINIPGDQTTLSVTDESGGTGYWYKQTIYNSETEEETDLSQSIAVRGGDYGHYTTLDYIRDEAGFSENSYLDDGVVSRARDAAEAEITGVLATTGYSLPFEVEVPLLQNLSTQLAAAKLLVRDYGVGADGTSKDGRALAKEVRETLKQILSRELILVDAQGNLLLQLASNDTSTDTAETCVREPTFRMGDVF